MNKKEQTKAHLRGEKNYREYAKVQLLRTDLSKGERERLELMLELTEQNIERLEGLVR